MAEARILYLATADGVVQLANPGKSDRWREISRSLAGQGIRAVSAAPADPLLAYATTGQGIYRTRDGGASWQQVSDEPARALVFNADDVIFAGTERGVVLSSQDGTTWSEADASSAPIVQLLALDDGTLLSVAADGTVCERRTDAWKARELHVPNVRGLAARPGETADLFVVNKTSLVVPHGAHRLPEKPTGALLLLAGQSPVLLIGTEGPLMRSERDGDDLAPVAGPSHVIALVTPPRFIDQAFAGTADGALWYSGDRGRTWAELRSGYTAIRAIAFARAL